MRDYPNLTQLTIRNAVFGDLPDLGLFKKNIHYNVKKLQFINTGITSFGPTTFSGVPSVSTFTLDENPLNAVKPGLFKFMPELETLNLNEVFTANNNHTRTVLRNLFETEIPTLRSLSLRSNYLESESLNFLCKLPNLTRLELTGNRLNEFKLPTECTPPIKELLLNDNNLTGVPVLGDIPIEQLIVYTNPLQCDWRICEREDLINAIEFKNFTYCLTPPGRKHEPLIDILEHTDCLSPKVLHYVVILIVLIFVIAILVILWNGCFYGQSFAVNDNYSMARLNEEADETDPSV